MLTQWTLNPDPLNLPFYSYFPEVNHSCFLRRTHLPSKYLRIITSDLVHLRILVLLVWLFLREYKIHLNLLCFKRVIEATNRKTKMSFFYWFDFSRHRHNFAKDFRIWIVINKMREWYKCESKPISLCTSYEPKWWHLLFNV